MALVVAITQGESVRIGADIILRAKSEGRRVRLFIEAPKEMRIDREKINNFKTPDLDHPNVKRRIVKEAECEK